MFLTITCKYSRHLDGSFDRTNARSYIRDDIMLPGIHYDSSNTAAYTIVKSTVRIIYALTARRCHLLRHLDINSTFTNKGYRHTRPFFDGHLQIASSMLTPPTCPFSLLHLNIYGTRPSCHIYHSGLDYHLCARGYIPSQA